MDMNQKYTLQGNAAVAVIGMGCIFPKSRTLKEFWHLLYHGIDAIEDIPADTHWKLNDYFDEDPARPDHTYCRRGGFLPPVTFDPLSYGIPPNNMEATDTSQLLGLEVAKMALEDAGYPMGHPFLEQKKVNVILGVTGTQELVIPLGARLGRPIWKKALEDAGISKEKKEEIIQRMQGGYVEWQENSFPGLLGNVVAGRIANRMNLSGTNTVADAACASALSAIHTAVMELLSGKCDMSVTGGVDTLNDIFMHMCFSKTGVLSRTSDARPFSKDADGTVLGEGIGMLVLKRLEDAQKDKDKIYALIKGVGTSSDGRTSAIYAPDAKGQLKALTEAYREAGIDPSTVGLVEAHGTGTRVGDKVEFEALKLCFDPSGEKHPTALGSVKSMIGHTKAAAGAAGMIKAALSLYNKVIPPTLKALEPDPDLRIEDSPFYLNSVSKPWIGSSHPRRSGVSAFGFGGSNFHVVLEEYSPRKTHISWEGSVQIIAFSSATRDDLIKEIHCFRDMLPPLGDAFQMKQTIAQNAHETRKNFLPDSQFRILLVHKTDEDIFSLLDQALETIDTGQSKPGVYFSPGFRKGKLGFLFPGQGSQYTGMGRDLVSLFPEAMEALNEASQIFLHENPVPGDKALQDHIYPPPLYLQPKDLSEDQLRGTDIAQPAIGAISAAMIKVLKRFGVSPEITCGHSFGELCALYSAGWMDEAALFHLSAARGKYMAAAKSLGADPGSMLAVQAPLPDIQALIAEERLDLVLANKNSPFQGVLSGSTDEILRAKKICKQKKLRAVQLPVAAAFHSRLVENAVAPFKAFLSSKSFHPTGIEVLSNTTGGAYDRKESEIKRILGDQPVNPVNFLGNIENMFEKGVSTFIELGPKAVLTDLTKSILKDREITAVSLDASCGKKSGIEDLAHVLCVIASKGFPVDLTPWEDPVKKIEPKRMKIELTGANPKPANRNSIPVSEPKAPVHENPRTDHRSMLKGPDMTSEQRPTPSSLSFPALEAMKWWKRALKPCKSFRPGLREPMKNFWIPRPRRVKPWPPCWNRPETSGFPPFQPLGPRLKPWRNQYRISLLKNPRKFYLQALQNTRRPSLPAPWITGLNRSCLRL
nr:acyltransferase domain-containing protein [Desulfobacula sp.]